MMPIGRAQFGREPLAALSFLLGPRRVVGIPTCLGMREGVFGSSDLLEGITADSEVNFPKPVRVRRQRRPAVCPLDNVDLVRRFNAQREVWRAPQLGTTKAVSIAPASDAVTKLISVSCSSTAAKVKHPVGRQHRLDARLILDDFSPRAEGRSF